MISAGSVNALVAWATGNDERIAQLVTERDALVARFFTGGKPTGTITSASANGKSFTYDPQMTADDKLAVITSILTILGEIDSDTTEPTIVYANFQDIRR